MTRRPDIACAKCDRPMWRGHGTLPEGQATCQPCRRADPGYLTPRPPNPHVSELRFCKVCSNAFESKRDNQVYCSPDCRNSRRGWSRARPSTDERGYGAEHQRERRKWKPTVDAGHATCCLCGYPIDAGTPWHLDHTPDRSGYRGPAHAACNVLDGAKRGAARSKGDTNPVTPPRWTL